VTALIFMCAYCLGAATAAAVIVWTSDWMRLRRLRKQQLRLEMNRLGRLAMLEEHGRTLMAASNAIRLDGSWR